jgi:hypothetical protein
MEGFKYTCFSGIDIDAYTSLGEHIAKLQAVSGSVMREMSPVYIMPGTLNERGRTAIGGTLIFAETPKVNLPDHSFNIVLKAKHNDEEKMSQILEVEILTEGNTIQELTTLDVDAQHTYIARHVTAWKDEQWHKDRFSNER